MSTVVLIGTLDTKGPEYAFVKERLIETSAGQNGVAAGIELSGVGEYFAGIILDMRVHTGQFMLGKMLCALPDQ